MKQAEVVTEVAKPPAPCPDCKVGTLHVTMITDAKAESSTAARCLITVLRISIPVEVRPRQQP